MTLKNFLPEGLKSPTGKKNSEGYKIIATILLLYCAIVLVGRDEDARTF